MKEQTFKLHGKVQHYAWGGFDYIPNLLGFDNAQQIPCAEYWLGTHPSGPGKLDTPTGSAPWRQLIEQEPEKFLGMPVYNRFGGLPYLLKVLDVREMLSIQVHPTKEEAAKGFDHEEATGVPIDAKHRNYKDRNHKPEVMIALGDFWLLHGFLPQKKLMNVLKQTPEFTSLESIFINHGYAGLYKHIMELPQADVDAMLLPLVTRALNESVAKEQPGFWVKKLYASAQPENNFDRGIFSIYFFNIVRLAKGEGIFQAAGVPHAYMEGQNVELMANSDNVLRGGLTPKHIDVPELLKHTIFEAITPAVLIPSDTGNGEKMYKMPVEDFGICTIQLDNGREYVSESNSPETFLVMDGEVICGDIVCKKGESFIVLPNTEYTIRGIKDSLIYKAFVPVP